MSWGKMRSIGLFIGTVALLVAYTDAFTSTSGQPFLGQYTEATIWCLFCGLALIDYALLRAVKGVRPGKISLLLKPDAGGQ